MDRYDPLIARGARVQTLNAADGSLTVTFDTDPGDGHGPCYGWLPQGDGSLPVTGDRALIVEDETGRYWVAAWTPATHIKPHGTPMFTHEATDIEELDAAFAFFEGYAVAGPYWTILATDQETAFRAWVTKYDVPFDPDAAITDYDMRGFWLAHQSATHDAGQHFTDKYKTPYDTTFSRESKYALASCPFDWVGNMTINVITGEIIFEGSD